MAARSNRSRTDKRPASTLRPEICRHHRIPDRAIGRVRVPCSMLGSAAGSLRSFHGEISVTDITLDNNGIKLAASIYGPADGEPILFLHGISLSRDTWH